jgi:hypothetical protein
MTHEQRKAIFWGLFAAALLGVAIFVGSRNLRHIDAALVGYTFACLFSVFGLSYRYSMWLQRPPPDCTGGAAGSLFSGGAAAGRTSKPSPPDSSASSC